MPSPAALDLLSTLPAQDAARTSDGRVVSLQDLNRGTGEPAPSRRDNTVQTDRWPLPGSGELHPLDKIRICDVWLPLAEMPQGSWELDVSERKEPGSDYSTFVGHGVKSTPVRIVLLLFRDDTLGWRDGERVGKDWHAEWRKVSEKVRAKHFDARGAVPVYYPTLQARGVTSLVFKRVGDPQRARGLFFTVELEGHDPRTIRRGGGSHKVKNLKDFGTRANPIPPQQQAAKSPSTGKRGK